MMQYIASVPQRYEKRWDCPNMVKKTQIIKNFYDDDVKKKLNGWTYYNYQDSYKFRPAHNNPPNTSYTTRWTKGDIGFPQEAFDLRQKIIDVLNLKNYSLRYGAGIINTVSFPGCQKWSHIDKSDVEDHIIYHCNIISKKATGGETVIEGVEYDVQENDLICYAVSELTHEVNLIKDTMRIAWIFGFYIPRVELEV